MSLPGEGGDISLPGEEPHAMGGMSFPGDDCSQAAA